MQPAPFPEANLVLAKPVGMTGDECGALHVWSDGQDCVSLWRPSLRERLSILIFGRVWLFVHSGASQPPVALDARRHIFQEVDA